MKVVINCEFGGYGLSEAAIKRYAELAGINLVTEKSAWGSSYYYKDYVSNNTFFSDYNIPRNDPALVQVIEELGEDANGPSSFLKVVEVPDTVEWMIQDYDGVEWVAEVHRTWR
jgi:hypothetical protein